jgi:hypothetical protein
LTLIEQRKHVLPLQKVSIPSEELESMGKLMSKRLDSITEKDNNFSILNATPQMPAFN